MAELVNTRAEIAENIRRLSSYGNGNEEERKFHKHTIKNGKLFVYFRDGETNLFAPSKFAGYAENNLQVSRGEGRDGRDTNPHLDRLIGRHLEPGNPRYSEIDGLFLDYCKKFSIVPSAHHKERRYWSLNSNDLYINPITEAQTGSKRSNLWSDSELAAAVEAYFQMLDLETSKTPYSKAQFRIALLAGPLKGRKSIDQRMQNISFVLREAGREWIPGYKPLSNVGDSTKQRLGKIIEALQPAFEGLAPLTAPVLRPGRKLPPTGYWMFVCRRGRWDGTVWLRGDSTETLYMISENHKDEVQVGDLGVLRLNKLAKTRNASEQPAGVYALLEVIESPQPRESDHAEGFSDPNDAATKRWRAKVRLLSNLVDKPVDAFSLPDGSDFKFLRNPLPQSTIPITRSAFDQIVKQSGISSSEIIEKRATSTLAGVQKLERRAANLDPQRKEKISNAIERGVIGSKVKAARNYRCQLCEAIGKDPVAFLKKSGVAYAEAHHVHPVSLMLAGSLSDTNIMVLCANHHRQAHFGDFEVEEHRLHDWVVRLDDVSISVPRTRLSDC